MGAHPTPRKRGGGGKTWEKEEKGIEVQRTKPRNPNRAIATLIRGEEQNLKRTRKKRNREHGVELAKNGDKVYYKKKNWRRKMERS